MVKRYEEKGAGWDDSRVYRSLDMSGTDPAGGHEALFLGSFSCSARGFPPQDARDGNSTTCVMGVFHTWGDGDSLSYCALRFCLLDTRSKAEIVFGGRMQGLGSTSSTREKSCTKPQVNEREIRGTG